MAVSSWLNPIRVSEPIQERVAVVTGASGGLGSALVREFSRQNWRVAAVRRRPIERDAGDAGKTFICDVTSWDEIDACLKSIVDHFGRVDCLVNNAGITRDQSLLRMGEADLDEVLSVNLKGPARWSREISPNLAKTRGSIINISSFAGRSGAAGQANYSASKAALLGLTQSLAREFGAEKSGRIRVNAILPGVMPTAMTNKLDEVQLDALRRANILERLNDVDEVARFVVFLAGMKNVSGQVFQLDSRISPWT